MPVARDDNQDNRVKVEVKDDKYVHRPLKSFEDADFPKVFYEVIDELGFDKPTAI
jgi:superfamily II DNA/RNA helicase